MFGDVRRTYELECIALEASMLPLSDDSTSLWSDLVTSTAHAADMERGTGHVDGVSLLQKLFEQAVVSKIMESCVEGDMDGSDLESSLSMFAFCSTLFRSLIERLEVITVMCDTSTSIKK